MLAFFLGAALALGGCARPPAVSTLEGAQAAEGPVSAFQVRPLPAAQGATLLALERAPRVPPLRYRVIVVPGSGCAGLGAWADRYFAGLQHAQVLVLHKRGVQPSARTAPGDCPAWFVQSDALSAWQADAQVAVQAWQAALPGSDVLPTVLVGISEGAELLPGLAPEVPRLSGLVLLSASGLDPREAAALQARRLGALAEWDALGRLQASPTPDSAVAQGRSLRYWRDLWHWRLAEPLRNGPWPLLQVWGEADALVPQEAYQAFAQRAQARRAPYCHRSLPGADHGLQTATRDGVQQVWAWLEQWARQPALGWCAPSLR
ncbi:MAG: alpha/beta hydrolase [Burkholderiaceae bacterium]|nr:alpha/beta hydrolase [Burkholderiaceae bacterium]